MRNVPPADAVQPVRTVIAALLGGVIGAIVIGYTTGQVVSWVLPAEQGAWAALGIAILGAAAGGFVGAAVALSVAFRRDARRVRLVTALTVLLGGPLLLTAVGAVASRLDADWNVPPLWLAVCVVVAAVVGRWLAVRGRRT